MNLVWKPQGSSERCFCKGVWLAAVHPHHGNGKYVVRVFLPDGMRNGYDTDATNLEEARKKAEDYINQWFGNFND